MALGERAARARRHVAGDVVDEDDAGRAALPARCTTLTMKLQAPRSMTAILPVTFAGSLARVGGVPGPVVPVISAVLPSSAGERQSVMSNVCGPKADAPMRIGERERARGARCDSAIPSTRTSACAGASRRPEVLMLALFDCPESALSCASARIGSPSAPPRPKLESLRVAGCLVEPGVVPEVVQPVVHIEELRDRGLDLVGARVGRLVEIVDAIERLGARDLG